MEKQQEVHGNAVRKRQGERICISILNAIKSVGKSIQVAYKANQVFLKK